MAGLAEGATCDSTPDQCPASTGGSGGGSAGSTAPTKVTTSFGYPLGTTPRESPGAIPESLREYDQSHHINYTESQLRATEVAFGEAYSAERLYDLAVQYAAQFRDDPAELAGAEQGLLHPGGWGQILAVAKSCWHLSPLGMRAQTRLWTP